jgi:hypothetical protein
MQLPKMDPNPGKAARTFQNDPDLMSGELQHFLPDSALLYVISWFLGNPVHLRISRSRTTKYGDYRMPGKGLPARISVNQNLNRYDFLITLVHEMAHHEVFSNPYKTNGFSLFSRKRTRPKPHGEEWKEMYRLLMRPVMNTEVFPQEIMENLVNYFNNPRAAAGTSHHLATVLNRYNVPDGKEFIEDLPADTLFQIPGGRIFMKKEKLRKRYRCISLANKRAYLFSPVARVSRVGLD